MAQTSFMLDEDAMRVLDRLKATFNVKSDGDALIRALTLARVAADNANTDHEVLIFAPDKSGIRKIRLDK